MEVTRASWVKKKSDSRTGVENIHDESGASYSAKK